MKKNDVLRLTCGNLGADLEGVCRAEGMAVFVPGLLPGEEADVRVVKVQPRYAFGRIERLLQPSPDRIPPDCPAYPRCGGCTGRHMRYEATLLAKQRQVDDCFRRIGHLEIEVKPVIGMAHPAAYRNKTALPVGGTDAEPLLGFYAPRSHSVIPVRACPNAMPPANELQQIFQRWAGKHGISVYDETTGRGLLRHLVIRVNRAGQAMVTVVINGKALPETESLADELFAQGCTSLYVNRNTRATNVIFGPEFQLLRGDPVLTETLLGYRYELNPASFFQVNPVQTECLYRLAVEAAAAGPEELICDLYCGAGTISLPLAARCKKVLGIEIVPQAIENARRNAEINGIRNTDFRCGAAEELLPRLVREGLRLDCVVVDPPRKGLDPAVIHAIAEVSPRRVVYVSCNPATLARDAALLTAEGYSVRSAQPVDMFCWTSGVETVCAFDRTKKAIRTDEWRTP